MMNPLKAWLGCTGTVDPFELAVIQGMVAQETAAEAIRNFLGIEETEMPGWLTLWAASLNSDQAEAIRRRRDAEQASLLQDVEILLGEDPEKWTEAERSHATVVQKRLMAVNLVLRARDAAKKRAERAAFRPTEEMAATAAA